MAVTTSRQSTPFSSTLALSMLVSFLRRNRAARKADVRDALDFRRGIDHRVNRAQNLPLPAPPEISSVFFGWPKYMPPVSSRTTRMSMPSPCRSLAERAGVGQFLRQLHRAQIGEEPELLAQPQQRGAFGAFLLGDGRVAVRQAHRAEQDAIRRLAQRERGVGQRLAGGVNARPADRRFGDLHRQRKFFLHHAQHLDGFAHDLGADAVARQRRNVQIR